MTILQIKNLHVTVDTEQGTKEILKGVDLVIRSGESHAIMGPNGSGKSTLAYTIAGHPKYTVTEGDAARFARTAPSVERCWPWNVCAPVAEPAVAPGPPPPVSP